MVEPPCGLISLPRLAAHSADVSNSCSNLRAAFGFDGPSPLPKRRRRGGSEAKLRGRRAAERQGISSSAPALPQLKSASRCAGPGSGRDARREAKALGRTAAWLGEPSRHDAVMVGGRRPWWPGYGPRAHGGPLPGSRSPLDHLVIRRGERESMVAALLREDRATCSKLTAYPPSPLPPARKAPLSGRHLPVVSRPPADASPPQVAPPRTLEPNAPAVLAPSCVGRAYVEGAARPTALAACERALRGRPDSGVASLVASTSSSRCATADEMVVRGGVGGSIWYSGEDARQVQFTEAVAELDSKVTNASVTPEALDADKNDGRSPAIQSRSASPLGQSDAGSCERTAVDEPAATKQSIVSANAPGVLCASREDLDIAGGPLVEACESSLIQLGVHQSGEECGACTRDGRQGGYALGDYAAARLNFLEEHGKQLFQNLASEGVVPLDVLADALLALRRPRPRQDWIDEAVEEASNALTGCARSFFDKEDFLAFVAAYERRCWTQWFDMFRRAGPDDLGRLDIEFLPGVLEELDTPAMPGALAEFTLEALRLRERPDEQHVDHDQFALICDLCVERAGFTHWEYETLRSLFGRAQGDRWNLRGQGLDAAGLRRALRLDRTNCIDDASQDASLLREVEAAGNCGWGEFLALMRRRRAHGLWRVKKAVQASLRSGVHVAAGKTSRLSFEALPELFTNLGFENAAPWLLQEFAAEVGLDPNASAGAPEGFGFDDVYAVLQAFCRSSGLSRAQLEQVSDLFAELDPDGSGGIGRGELQYVLRRLGHATTYEEVRRMFDAFNLDESSKLEADELERLVAEHLRQEVVRTRRAFSSVACGGDRLPPSQARMVLLYLGYAPSREELQALHHHVRARRQNEATAVATTLSEDCEEEHVRTYDVWEVIAMVDHFRGWLREAFHRNHGFSEDEVAQLRLDFDNCGPDADGLINVAQFAGRLLKKYPVAVRDRLVAAWRRAAGEGSLAPSLTSSPTSSPRSSPHGRGRGGRGRASGRGGLNFAEFLRMMRIFRDEQDFERLEEESKVAQALGYSAGEVRDLRQLFEGLDTDGSGDTSLEELLVYVRIFFPRVSTKQASELHNHLISYDDDGNRALDFLEFMKLIRHLMDSDWHGISTKAASAAAG